MSKFIVSRNISAFEDLSKLKALKELSRVAYIYPKNHVWNPKNVICIPQKLFGILFLSACNIGRLYFLAQHTRKICTTRHGLCSRGSMMWNTYVKCLPFGQHSRSVRLQCHPALAMVSNTFRQTAASSLDDASLVPFQNTFQQQSVSFINDVPVLAIIHDVLSWQ